MSFAVKEQLAKSVSNVEMTGLTRRKEDCDADAGQCFGRCVSMSATKGNKSGLCVVPLMRGRRLSRYSIAVCARKVHSSCTNQDAFVLNAFDLFGVSEQE